METISDIREKYIQGRSICELQKIAAKAWSIIVCYEGNDDIIFYCEMAELKERMTKTHFEDFEKSFKI